MSSLNTGGRMKLLLLFSLGLAPVAFSETVEENVKRSATQLKKDLQRIETNVRRNLGDKSVSKKSKTSDSEATAEAKKK